MTRKLAIAALIALAVGPALAQTPPAGTPTRIRGTVDKLDGQNLMVKSRDSQTLTIASSPPMLPTGEFFPKGPRSMRQGANRCERAHNYVRAGHATAPALQTTCTRNLGPPL
ncbi:MAG TPA: hypothetical protein VNN75_07690 [Stellaceae bacterium]|jgi:hypothetical protein|nr:hypothetical protein [Stellaceae bacterium]